MPTLPTLYMYMYLLGNSNDFIYFGKFSEFDNDVGPVEKIEMSKYEQVRDLIVWETKLQLR